MVQSCGLKKSSKGLEECCIAWRKGARRIFNMSYQTHSFLVGPLSGQRSIDEMLQCSAQVFKRAGCHLKRAHLAR